MCSILKGVHARASAAAIALVIVAGIPPVAAQSGAQLDVLQSGGFNAAYQVLQPDCQQSTNVTISTVLCQPVGCTPTAIPDRLANGEPADLVIMTRELLEQLVTESLLLAGSEVDLAASGIGIAVPAGAPVIDIGTPQPWEAALAGAEVIGVSTSASGVYLKDTLFPTLGNAETVLPKTKSIGDKPVDEAQSFIDYLAALEAIAATGLLPTVRQ